MNFFVIRFNNANLEADTFETHS